MAEEGLIMSIITGRRRVSPRGAIIDFLAFAAVTAIGGFFLGVGWSFADTVLKSSIRDISYKHPDLVPPSMQEEVFKGNGPYNNLNLG